MATPTLAEIADVAAAAEEPAFTSSYVPQLGGVDPLGLRQINFDLMDQVLPGLNNVARHIRPFTVVAWAWSRAAKCAQDTGKTTVSVSSLKDFVDRIEVIYAWSQFVRNRDAELPGRDVLSPLLVAQKYVFGGSEWQKRRKTRAYSTAFSAPINYGPALKALGWLHPHSDGNGALIATPVVRDALAAFEACIGDRLEHPAFSQFGPVEVKRVEAEAWADAWALEYPTESERRAMALTLAGDMAQKQRRRGAELVIAAAKHLGKDAQLSALRRAMCGAPTDFVPGPGLEEAVCAWRMVQLRQAFRLALEGLFHWVIQHLDGEPMGTRNLVEHFLNDAGHAATAGEWLRAVDIAGTNPVDWITRLERNLADGPAGLPRTIRGALAACLAEAPEVAGAERNDRLPLARAAQEVRGWKDASVEDFVAHVIESWVFGQHVYWSVGRGLADARARGKTILRLKIVLEEGGWGLTPGTRAAARNAPAPTPDRLGTVVSLLREAEFIE